MKRRRFLIVLRKFFVFCFKWINFVLLRLRGRKIVFVREVSEKLSVIKLYEWENWG